MVDLLHYLLEANLILLVVVFTYAMLFRRLPYHRFNRALLNAGLCSAFLLPLLEWAAPNGSVYTVWLTPLNLASPITPEGMGGNTGTLWIVGAYLLGAAVMAAHVFRGSATLFGLLKKSTYHRSNNIRMVVAPRLPSGSFFNTVFLDADLTEQERKAVLAHELVHVKEVHSADLLLFRLVNIVCWFNPAVYLLCKMLEENHEFRADAVAQSRVDPSIDYPELIVAHAFDLPKFPAHPFSNKTLLKRRIMMMIQNNPKKSTLLRYVMLVPALAATLLVHSCSKDMRTSESAQTDQPNESAVQKSTPAELDKNTSSADDSEVYTKVDEMPKFPGGQQAMFEFLGRQIHYPEALKSTAKQGTVHTTFVIDETGEVTQPAIRQSPDPAFSAAALEAIGQMPTWIPGKKDGVPVKVQYVLPIRFELSDAKKLTNPK